MWIIRFQKLQTKDYNKLTRLIQKSGFRTRHIPPIVYAKSLIHHKLEKRSLRKIALGYNVSHIGLHKFFKYIAQTPEYQKIFHVFLESKSALYIEDTRVFSVGDLDNDTQIYTLTEKQLGSILC